MSTLDEIRARDADSTVAAATDGPWYFAGAPKSRLYEIRTKLCDNPGSGCKRGELICRHVERAADANLIAHAVETAFDRRTLLALLDAQSLELHQFQEAALAATTLKNEAQKELQAVREALERAEKNFEWLRQCSYSDVRVYAKNSLDSIAALKQSRGA